MKFFNRMSDTTVYRYATGFTIAVLSALKSTLMWILERGSLFLGSHRYNSGDCH